MAMRCLAQASTRSAAENKIFLEASARPSLKPKKSELTMGIDGALCKSRIYILAEASAKPSVKTKLTRPLVTQWML